MSEFLIVVLDESKPGLVLVPDNQNAVDWHGIELRDTGIRTLVGFFDWLRTDAKETIGVRLTIIDEELDYLMPDLMRPSYVCALPNNIGIEIFFTENTEYNFDYSDDQDFMDNWIYRSTNGLFAISFNTRFAIDSLKTNSKINLIEL